MKAVFKFALGGVPYGRFTDVKRLRAGPRGFCLSRLCTLKQKHRCGLRLPHVHPAGGVLSHKIKNPTLGGAF